MEGLAAAADAALAELAAAARADLVLIKERVDRIKRDFYEIGVALLRLKDPRRVAALGYRSFQEMCAREIELPPSTVNELVAIASNMSEGLARGAGHSKALGMVRLCQATPEDDRPEDIAEAEVPLPSGGVIDVKGATAREVNEAAKEIRRANPKAGSRGGRTVKSTDRATAAELEKKLRAAGLERARVQAVATRAGQPGDLKIEGVPVGAVGTLCSAICGTKAAGRRVKR